jgi:SPP1 gp7 family putative phage head morphogenesis protein
MVKLKILQGSTSDRDPTRSITLRKRFIAEMNKRFRALKGDINKTIVDNDALGIADRQPPLTLAPAAPKAFAFTRDVTKVEGFMAWLREQEEQGILEVTAAPGSPTGTEPWTNPHIRSSYQKGMADARNKLISAGAPVASFSESIGGISAAFNTPFHAERVQLIYTRVFSELKGITAAMEQQIQRELSRGLAEGIGPREMARRLNNRVNKIGLSRAKTLARTEMIEALNEGALGEYTRAEGVIGEEVLVRWQTAQDERVRSSHRVRHGVVFKKQQAQTLIGEPNCRCALLPYIESVHGDLSTEDKKEATTITKQKRKAA